MSSLPATATSTDGLQPCRLLKLPAELRNKIIRLVVVTSNERNPIEITYTGFERSALFLTCKKIYRDAIKIYLLENRFYHLVSQYNSVPLVRFGYLYKRFLERKQLNEVRFYCEVEFSAFDDESDNGFWDNLICYLQNVHAGRVPKGPPPSLNITKRASDSEMDLMLYHVIGTMFLIVVELAGTSWDVLLKIFNGMRPSLIALDAVWAKDSNRRAVS